MSSDSFIFGKIQDSFVRHYVCILQCLSELKILCSSYETDCVPYNKYFKEYHKLLKEREQLIETKLYKCLGRYYEECVFEIKQIDQVLCFFQSIGEYIDLHGNEHLKNNKVSIMQAIYESVYQKKYPSLMLCNLKQKKVQLMNRLNRFFRKRTDIPPQYRRKEEGTKLKDPTLIFGDPRPHPFVFYRIFQINKELRELDLILNDTVCNKITSLKSLIISTKNKYNYTVRNIQGLLRFNKDYILAAIDEFKNTRIKVNEDGTFSICLQDETESSKFLFTLSDIQVNVPKLKEIKSVFCDSFEDFIESLKSFLSTSIL